MAALIDVATADLSCAAKLLEVPFHVYDENGACILKVGRSDQIPHCIAYTTNHFVVIDPQDANLQDPRGDLSLTLPFRGAESSQVPPWDRQQRAQALMLDVVTEPPRVPWLDLTHLGDIDLRIRAASPGMDICGGPLSGSFVQGQHRARIEAPQVAKVEQVMEDALTILGFP
eukprot:3332751-Amphidinium_carterae.3